MQPQAPAARGLSALALIASQQACAAASPAPSPIVEIPAPTAAAPERARTAGVEPRIRQLRVGEYEVEAPLFDALIDAPERVAPRLRAELLREDGRPLGYQIDGFSPTSVLGRLGLVEGDVIVVVNGVGSVSPENIEAARATARRTGQVTVVLRRNGFDKLLVYRLVYY